MTNWNNMTLKIVCVIVLVIQLSLQILILIIFWWTKNHTRVFHNTVHNISHKILIGAKLLCTRFDKIDEFIRFYDGTKYLVLFGAKKYDFIYDRVRYLKEIKTDIIFHNLAKIKINLNYSVLVEKRLLLNNVITFPH